MFLAGLIVAHLTFFPFHHLNFLNFFHQKKWAKKKNQLFCQKLYIKGIDLENTNAPFKASYMV